MLMNLLLVELAYILNVRLSDTLKHDLEFVLTCKSPLEFLKHPGYALKVLYWLPGGLVFALPLDLVAQSPIDIGLGQEPLNFVGTAVHVRY